MLTFIMGLIAACNQGASELRSANGSANPLAPSFWPAGQAAFPLNVRLSTNFDAAENIVVQASASSWSSAVGNRVNFFDTAGSIAEKGGSLDSYNDGIMGVYKLTSWPSDLPVTALAVTQIFGLRRNIGQSNEAIEISHADILVNYDNWSFTTTGGAGYDLETVVLHEFGHFLGLGHDNSSTSQSVMFPTISRFTTNKAPLDRDKTAIASLYNISGVVSAGASRSIANVQDDQDKGETEAVVIQFELRADGSERVKVDGKYISNYKCKHKH